MFQGRSPTADARRRIPSCPAPAALALLASLVVAFASPAAAQTILDDNRLYCPATVGSQSFDLDAFSRSTDKVFEARSRQIEAAFGSLQPAIEACSFATELVPAHECTADPGDAAPAPDCRALPGRPEWTRCLPGCQRLAVLLQSRVACDQQGYPPSIRTAQERTSAFVAREHAASLDAQLADAARRVLSNQQCRDHAMAYCQASDSCIQLALAEDPGPTPRTVVFEHHLIASCPHALLAALGNPPAQSRLGFAGVLWIYQHIDFQTRITDAIRRYALTVDQGSHPFTGNPPPHDGILDLAYRNEYAGLAARGTVCEDSMFYIGPTGGVMVRPDRPQTLCVDISEGTLNRSFRVQMGRHTFAVWPGEAISIADLALSPLSVVRITVNRLPSGHSLRSLAERSALLAVPMADIDSVLQAVEAAVTPSAAGSTTTPPAANGASGQVSLLTANTALRLAQQRLDAASQTADALRVLLHPPHASESPDENQALLAPRVSEAQDLLEHPASHHTTQTPAVMPSRPSTPDGGVPSHAQATDTAVATAAPALNPQALNAARDQLSIAQQRLTEKLHELCMVTETYTPVVFEDVLVRDPSTNPSLAMMFYDYDMGFQGLWVAREPSSAAHPPTMDEGDHTFVVVQGVPVDQTVHVELGDRGIVHQSLYLVGATHPTQTAGTPVPLDRGASTPHGIFDLNDTEFILPGQRVIRLDHLSGQHTYDITVCTTVPGGASSCNPGPSAAGASGVHTIGANATRVSGRSYLGLRAGLAINVANAQAPIPVLASTPSVSSEAVWRVTTQRTDTEFALPLLLVAYPWGRDALDPGGVSFGVGLGTDLTSPIHRLFPAAIVLDVGGVGLTLGFTFENLLVATVAPGTTFTASQAGAPALGSRFGLTSEWAPGLAGGFTFDLDLFERAFGAVFGSRLPVMGALP